VGSGLFPEISCVLCSKSVDLCADLCADENGKAVHDHCYINHILKPRPAGVWKTLRSRWQRSGFGLEGLRNK
jgi:predicted amidophosphoribosyltransferase